MLLSNLLVNLLVTGSVAHAGSIARQIQQPLQPISSYNEAVHTNKGKPVTDGWARWFQTTNITAGTPPQSFRATIDIGWTDMMLPSVDCATVGSPSALCKQATNLYNASASSSSNNDTGRDGIHVARLYYLDRWEGEYINDDMSVGGVQLSNVSFVSASSVRPNGFVEMFDFDAVLGLPRYPQRVRGSIDLDVPPGPFHQMIQEGLLKRNIFSLKLAQDRDAKGGQLLFGEIDHSQYVGPLVTMPVTPIDREVEETELASAWHVALHEVRFGDSFASWPATKAHAVFSSTDPFTYLPAELTRELLEEIGADGGLLPGVDCDKRGSMPDIHFMLGPDKMAFGLTPWQYIVEFNVTEDETTCYAPFFPFDAGEPDLPGGEEAIILGSQFLRSFYSVFDVDNEEVSLAYIQQPHDEDTQSQRRYWQAPL